MMWLWLVCAWAAQSVDLNGDGKVEALSATTETVTIGSAQIDCSDMDEPCGVEVVDVLTSDGLKEVKVCTHGPREGPYCTLYRFDGNEARPIAVDGGTETLGDMTFSGSGIVLLSHHNRLFTKIEKYVLKGDQLKRVPQPAYHANLKVSVQSTFPIRVSTSGSQRRRECSSQQRDRARGADGGRGRLVSGQALIRHRFVTLEH